MKKKNELAFLEETDELGKANTHGDGGFKPFFPISFATRKGITTGCILPIGHSVLLP